VGFFADKIDQSVAADVTGEPPGCGLVDVHQGGVEFKSPRHAERQRRLHGLNGVGATVGIARVVGFAHAGDDVDNATPAGQRRGQSHIASRATMRTRSARHWYCDPN